MIVLDRRKTDGMRDQGMNEKLMEINLSRSGCCRTGKRLARRCRGFGSDQGGSVAIMYALLALPLMIAVGCAIDYMRAYAAQTVLQFNLDEALLSAGPAIPSLITTNNQIAKIIEVWISNGARNCTSSTQNVTANLNYNPDYRPGLPTTTNTWNYTISGTATSSVSTYFSQLLGMSTITISASSQVVGANITTTTYSLFSLPTTTNSAWVRLTQ